MQKAYKAFHAVAGRVLFIGFAVQIVLGICWMVANFGSLQSFGESILYVEISKTLICDEYRGVLYPVLILMARGIEEIFLIPYHCILYLLQLGLAYLAAYRFLKSVGAKGKLLTIGGSMAMLTFPMAMQCHLAVLPESLTGSFLLLELSYALSVVLNEKQLGSGDFVKVLLFWLFAALLQPEYLYLGGIPVAVLFLYGMVKAWKKDKKRILYNGILILAFVGMITGMEALTQVEGYYGRMHQSPGAILANRCAWLHVNEDYELWSEEVKQIIPWGEAAHIDYYADHMERILGRRLEEAVGVERTEKLLWEIGQIAWQQHRNAIIHDAAWDMVGYTFSPMVVQRQLAGKAYDSYTGRNYDIMRAQAPQLTEYYLNYGCWWFAVGLGISVLTELLVLVKKKREYWNAGKITALIGWIVTVGGVVLLYTMQGAGMMDYKKTVAVMLLWIAWMLQGCKGESA